MNTQTIEHQWTPPAGVVCRRRSPRPGVTAVWLVYKGTFAVYSSDEGELTNDVLDFAAKTLIEQAQAKQLRRSQRHDA